jgi:hypothetical protein
MGKRSKPGAKKFCGGRISYNASDYVQGSELLILIHY